MTSPEPRHLGRTYGLLPTFVVRMAGVPFSELAQLETPRTLAAGRRVLELERESDDAAARALEMLRTVRPEVDRQTVDWARRQVGARAPLTDLPAEVAELRDYIDAEAALARARDEFDAVLEADTTRVREVLVSAASRILRRHAVFSSVEVAQRIESVVRHPERFVRPRRSRDRTEARRRQRLLLRYLQRLCSKNDTISEFGPTLWGRVEPCSEKVVLRAKPGIARRTAFLETWVVKAFAEGMNDDPQVRLEVAPRPHPWGELSPDGFHRVDIDREIPLSADERELLLRCDGRTPAHELGSIDALDRLVDAGVLRWELEPDYLEPDTVQRLLEEIDAWRPVPSRMKWSRLLRETVEVAERFAVELSPDARRGFMEEVRARAQSLSGGLETTERRLGAATNPIGEECVREGDVILDDAVIGVFLEDAAPWFDLWSSAVCHVSSRVAESLRELFHRTPSRHGKIPFHRFLSACEASGSSLQVRRRVVAGRAYDELWQAFREEIKRTRRIDDSEWVLSEAECGYVRRRFDIQPFDEFSWPSADILLSASSVEAVANGEYLWVLGELHPSYAMMLHCFQWACPDPGAVHRAIRASTGGRTLPTQWTSSDAVARHNALHCREARELGLSTDGWSRDWAIVPPARTDVRLDEETGDLRLEERSTGRFLGSLTRDWALAPASFYPLAFDGQNPRVRLGRVVVQRRGWRFTSEELGVGGSGVTRGHELVRLAEVLRAEYGLPRHVFIRPSEREEMRQVNSGRVDKKPEYVDLESYPFLEMLARRLSKYGAIEATEMLPAPDQLLWKEDGRPYTFELRTQLVPRSRSS